jgi:hypothetical protein
MSKIVGVACEQEDIYFSSDDEMSMLTFTGSGIISVIIGVVAVLVSIRSGAEFFSGAWPFFFPLSATALAICAISFWKKIARLVALPVVIGLFLGFWPLYTVVYFVYRLFSGLFL